MSDNAKMLADLLRESQQSIGGDWRERRDKALAEFDATTSEPMEAAEPDGRTLAKERDAWFAELSGATLEGSPSGKYLRNRLELAFIGGWDARTKYAAPPAARSGQPVDMLLFCPRCGMQHVDAEEWEDHPHDINHEQRRSWDNPPHRSHLCHGCGHIWRPADVPTNGVAAIKTQGKKDGSANPADARSGQRRRVTEAARGEAEFCAMLMRDHRRMRAAGCALAEAALRVIREYDGVHRLSIAVSDWTKAIADEGDRAAIAHQKAGTGGEEGK